MNSPSFFRSATLAASLCVSSVFAAGEGWTSDFEAAKTTAVAEEKSLLINFTGSDWCGWCIRLDQEVFKHKAFKEGVKDQFVLVALDFPNDQSKVPEATAKQNRELQEKYGVTGFPTIVLADAEGRPFAQTGYKEGGPEKYLEHLQQLASVKAQRDAAFERAEQLQGAEKAQALIEALEALDLSDIMIANFYGDTIARIAAADPKDESGFIKGLQANKRFSEFESKLSAFAEAGDHDAALALVTSTLKEGVFDGEKKQQIILVQGMIYAEKEEFDAAIASLKEAKAAMPESELAGRIDGVITQIDEMRNLKEAERKADAGESADGEEAPGRDEEAAPEATPETE